MVAESIACPACGETLPHGRLSCPQCGTVLAAVARDYRTGTARAAVATPVATPAWLDRTRPAATAMTFADAAPQGHSQPDGGAGEPEQPGPEVGAGLVAASVAAFLAPATAPTPVYALPPAPAPGAWVPPAPVQAAPAETPAAVAGSSEPPARILPRAWDPAAAQAIHEPDGPGSAGARRRRVPSPDLDRARVDEAAGLVVLAGAMGAAVGFLLPWSRVVIGSRSIGGYFDSWGLASPGHLMVFLVVLATLALATVPNPIASWLRSGVPGLVLGGLLVGLAWPYAVGPLGAGIGIIVLVVSACLLLVGGLLSTLVRRHAEPSPAV